MEYISVAGEKLHYLKWGTGSKLLLAFHGYGNDAGLFKPFVPYLHNEYTILSFDLPHHGNTNWTKDKVFTKDELILFLKAVMQEYKVDKVSLMGFSMGGRVCLTMIQREPQLVDRVVLIASDGLRVDLFYFFLTRTWLGKFIFKNELEKPKWFFQVIEWLKRKKWVDAHKYKFVMNYMKPMQSRRFLMQVWPGMSQLMPLPSKLKKAIKKNHIAIAIFMGRHDKVMPPSLAEKFKVGLDSVELFILEKGHRVFDEGNAHVMAAHLL